MFAHKTTAAWERLISSLLQLGIDGHVLRWPFHTERKARMRANQVLPLPVASLSFAESVQVMPVAVFGTMFARNLRASHKERLDFFWSQGIRGADFFISAIGPALSVFGKYERVTKLSGEEVTVGQFLDEVRSLVTELRPGEDPQDHAHRHHRP